MKRTGTCSQPSQGLPLSMKNRKVQNLLQVCSQPAGETSSLVYEMVLRASHSAASGQRVLINVGFDLTRKSKYLLYCLLYELYR